MKRTGKLLSLFLTLAMVLSLFVPAMAADETPTYAIPDVKGKIVILHTNDVHGADVAASGTSIGTAGVVQLKKDFEAAGAKVLLLSSGDAIMGKPLVSADKGKTAIDFMNAANYDAMAVGNHELDFGLDNLKALAAQAQFPILDANMITVADGKTVFDGHKVFEIDGVKIGVFGLSTPETLTKADASKMPGVTFRQSEKLYEVAEVQVDALKAEGAQVIVCLGHLGVDAESAPNRSIDLCEAVDGIDLFIDGHSHSTPAQIISAIGNTEKNNIVNGTKIVSTGTALANVGVVIYDPAAKTLTDSLVSAKAYSKVDAKVAKLVNDRNAAVNKQYGSVKVGTSEVDLNGTQAGGKGTAENTKADILFPNGVGLRLSETNLGDFSADAILWQARKVLGEEKVDLALTNGGGIRKTLGKGDITMLDLLAVYPFGNTVATIDVTGTELLEGLEAATQFTPVSTSGGFPQVSGIAFTVKTAVPYAKGDQYPSATYYAPKTPGARVTITEVNGKAFDLNATYTVATNDFTAKGGDTYGMFKRVGGWKDTGVTLENALINYTKEALSGTITAEKYGQSAGRITLQTLPLDVKGNEWFIPAVEYALRAGVMNGVGAGNFATSGTVTRGTVVQTLYNKEGKPAVTSATFADAAGTWYTDAANWAGSAGIVKGDTAGKFNGENAITRQELAVMLTNYMSFKKMTTLKASLSKVSDAADIAAWAKDGMAYAIGAGILKGNGNAMQPAATATRAELAQILFNFSKLTPTAAEGSAPAAVTGTITGVEKYGNIVLDTMSINLYAAGYRAGDVLAVTVGEHTLELPLGTNYSDVGTGKLIARDATASSSPYLVIAINMGDFAKAYGAKVGDSVKLALKTAGGYLAEYEAHQVVRTNNRADYASDEVFANFREITLGNVAPGVLYRTSSPINPEIGRAAYADKLIQAAGIKTVVNLADSKAEVEGYFTGKDFASPYYKSLYEGGSVVTLSMGVDFTAPEFKTKLKSGLEFMLANKGPYVIHCNEGKDRAGFAAILLEALMGATKEEIVADYMLSYENYYHVEKGSDQYKTISRIAEDVLCQIAGLEKGSDLSKVDLGKAATNYITGMGITAEQVNTLKTALSTPITAQKAA